MPMFYGQIKMQKYLDDPEISFCAIGDAYVPENPAIQVTEFGQGKEIDNLISKLFIVGNGGGNEKESFELAGYFYKNRCKLKNSEFPFFFVTGDEGFYESVPKEYFESTFGIKINQNVSGKQIWKELMEKYNVFHLKKAYISQNKEVKIREQWVSTLGEERILQFKEPKACVDIMLGVISLTTGSRTLDSYVKDMKVREQTKERIALVKEILTPYWEKISSGQAKIIKETKENDNIDISNIISSLSSVNLVISMDKLRETREIVEKLMLIGVSNENATYIKNLRELSHNSSLTKPKELICPITNELMFEPVIALDGITYESRAIDFWLTNNQTSPSTGLEINKDFTVNDVVSKLVLEFYENNKHHIK